MDHITVLLSYFPAFYAYMKQSRYDWNLTSTPDVNGIYKYRKGHVSKMDQGKLLGGSDQIAYTIWGIGTPQDYNNIAKRVNDSSWDYNHILKYYIKRIEKVVDKKILNSPNVKYRGTNGKIGLKKYYPKYNNNFLQSYKEMGEKVVLDFNAENLLGFTNTFFSIDNGVRQSVASTYLTPERINPNLHVLYNSLATKIIFDKNKRAVGVQIRTESNTIVTVKARKEVIVSCGVVRSPHLLMLSGIGPQADLKSKNIKVIENLPDVGQNFQTQPLVIVLYKMRPITPPSPTNFNEFPIKFMTGFVSLNKSQFNRDYRVYSGLLIKKLLFQQDFAFDFAFTNELCDDIVKSSEGYQLFYNLISLLYPKSQGQVRLKNNNPEEYPLVTPGYYLNKDDLKKHAMCIKHYNRVLNTSYLKSVNAKMVYPKLKNCDMFDKKSMDYMECYVKSLNSPIHMYSGTCAMGTVVDAKLQVYGVKNLRVADASVIPSGIGSSLKGTVIIIALKLVDLLQNTYKLSSKSNN